MDESMWGIIISAVSASAAAYAVITSRRKVAAEADNIWVASASELTDTVMRQLDYLDREVEKLRTTIAKYREQVEEAARTEERLSGEIRTLRRQVQTLLDFIVDKGLEPPAGLETA